MPQAVHSRHNATLNNKKERAASRMKDRGGQREEIMACQTPASVRQLGMGAVARRATGPTVAGQ